MIPWMWSAGFAGVAFASAAAGWYGAAVLSAFYAAFLVIAALKEGA